MKSVYRQAEAMKDLQNGRIVERGHVDSPPTLKLQRSRDDNL